VSGVVGCDRSSRRCRGVSGGIVVDGVLCVEGEK
jgi:hypothetical protein